MLYDPYSFSRNGLPTITKKDGSTYSVQRSYISSGDQTGVIAMYGTKKLNKITVNTRVLSSHNDGTTKYGKEYIFTSEFPTMTDVIIEQEYYEQTDYSYCPSNEYEGTVISIIRQGATTSSPCNFYESESWGNSQDWGVIRRTIFPPKIVNPTAGTDNYYKYVLK